jgi:hypothetical protein
MENLLDESVPVLDRPVWPYAVGGVGGVTFAVGAFLLLRVVAGHGVIEPGYAIAALGAAMLAAAWFRIAKTHQTILPAVGSIGVVAAFAIGHVTSESVYELRVAVLAFAWSFAIFAATHAFAKGLAAVRVLGAVAAIPAVALLADSQASPEAVEVLFLFELACLAVMGIAIAVTLPRLRSI